MATHNTSTASTQASSLVESEEDSTIPFPPFDHSILADLPLDGSYDYSTMPQQQTTAPSPPFNPFASGKGYPEFPPDCENVVRGFPVHNDTLPLALMPVRCFPPPSNAAYEKALHAHLVKRWDGEENEVEAVAARERRLRMQRLKVMVVPQDGYFTEVRQEVDRSENRRPGGANEDRCGDKGKEVSVGLGIDGALRERGGYKHFRDEETGEFEVFTEARETQDGQGNEHAMQHGKHHEDEAAADSDEGLFMRRDVSRGERLARNIDFRRDTWVTTAPGVSGDILPASEQREDFINDINKHGEQLELCAVCNTAHIPPGPPITLADRDTCGSYLPRWFPAHLLARPWDTYRRLINELVALDEKTQEQRQRAGGEGYDPSRPRWDLEWHEADAEWVAAGRREGWWRCRRGPDAPAVERNCRVCHRARAAGEEVLTVGEEEALREERKRVLQGFIDQQVRVFGEMDREIALARMQLESMGLMERSVGGGGGGRHPRAAAENAPAPGATEAMARAVEEILKPSGSGSECESSGESGSAKMTPDSTASLPSACGAAVECAGWD